eukprot:TRINITY_DN5057_c0_g1_i1.p1 TRINITY_DN5057_c0_g1~~TRINITY_DN5057_c0_g1_i1.p1  ORF type:complete len:343 (-),score=45.45 TRINITY_DN5057_c0_g1_i1:12-1040(-)
MDITFESYPKDDVECDREAYKKALDNLKPGDLVIIFTPDNLHYDMIKDSVTKGMHVLVTKPAVQLLKHHLELIHLAKTKNVLVTTEVHKRWDPIYADAWQKIRTYGDFSYMYSYMSQPKKQLITFKQWAGKSSDISYYLNSHHIDFHVWAMSNKAKPIRVIANGSTGIATSPAYDIKTEDTITLMVSWVNSSGNLGTAVYTASWTAPTSDVHSQQRFFYMGQTGEINVDQAHRGYSIATDESGYASINPLFMKYSPDANGYFSGQSGYGYQSIEVFVNASSKLRSMPFLSAFEYDNSLATLNTTAKVTAILEAGRISLDNGGKAVKILYEEDGHMPSSLKIE